MHMIPIVYYYKYDQKTLSSKNAIPSSTPTYINIARHNSIKLFCFSNTKECILFSHSIFLVCLFLDLSRSNRKKITAIKRIRKLV